MAYIFWIGAAPLALIAILRSGWVGSLLGPSPYAIGTETLLFISGVLAALGCAVYGEGARQIRCVELRIQPDRAEFVLSNGPIEAVAWPKVPNDSKSQVLRLVERYAEESRPAGYRYFAKYYAPNGAIRSVPLTRGAFEGLLLSIGNAGVSIATVDGPPKGPGVSEKKVYWI